MIIVSRCRSAFGHDWEHEKQRHDEQCAAERGYPRCAHRDFVDQKPIALEGREGIDRSESRVGRCEECGLVEGQRAGRDEIREAQVVVEQDRLFGWAGRLKPS